MIADLKPQTLYFAYDTADDYEPLSNASKLLRQNEKLNTLINGHHVRCYILCGYKGDTVEKAENRIIKAANLGFFPMTMLLDGLPTV
jgi:hypothetical protein